MSKVAKRSSHSDYEKFKEYLFEMHERALRVYRRLSSVGKEYLRSYFKENFKEAREHYWTLRKLYCLAMYIPMFLQIGTTYFKVIYVDTHAGPGLAKVGEGEDELVLGSPLLAIVWPEIVASRNIYFKKIKKGFDALYFIDIDSKAIDVLREAVNYVTDDAKSWTSRIKFHVGDANDVLLSTVKGDIEKGFDKKKILVLMFIDPFGELESQLRYDVFREFIETFRTDVIFTVMSSSIARALSSKNGEELRKWVKGLWGEIRESDEGRRLSLCTFNEQGSRRVGVNDVVKAYKAVLEQRNYKVKVFEVTYGEKILYHLIVASKGDEWLNGYEKYVRERTPRDYKTLKNLFLQVRGKQAVL
jgi:three-Cys-motif partner protein